MFLYFQKQPKKVQGKSVQQKAAPRVGGKRQLLYLDLLIKKID